MDPIKEAFQKVKAEILDLKKEIQEIKQELQQTDNPTDNPTHIPTLITLSEPLKQPNLAFSTRNRGVPTDNPTNKPTHQQTDKSNENLSYQANFDDFEQARKILDSLDNIKKEIRLKFKRLTPKEMLVFSTIYQLEERNIEEITHKILANILNLSESSIREYINKLTKKGIPILKIRQNNRKILLKISQDLKKIASLSTIIQLREL